MNYVSEDGIETSLDLFKIRVHDNVLLKFIQICVNKFEKEILKGRMTAAVLNMVEIPIYDKNVKENMLKISKIISIEQR